jgi:hypothetical protein
MALPEILLVDDSRCDRDLFADALASSGLQARLAQCADVTAAVMHLSQADQRLGRALPALLVLDLSLPDLNGKTLMRIIRQAPAVDGLPIVVMTGSTRDADREDCQLIGVHDYLIKPSRFDELVGQVTSLGRFLAAPARAAAMA